MTSGRIGVLALAVALAASSAGCSITRSNAIEYKSARTIPPLELPPELARPGRDDRYQIPESAVQSPQGGSATLSTYNSERGAVPRAGTTDVLPELGKMQIRRAGAERWLVVPEAPEKLWPLVKDFWQDNGFLLKVEQPETGVMETEWNENRARIPNDGIRSIIGKVLDSAYSTGERDKYRTRLERGSEPNTTEVYISHRGMVETIVNTQSGSENTRWQPRKPDPDLEAEFLRRLMVRLGMDDAKARTTVASTATTPLPERARIVDDAGGTQTLALSEPFDRAWRRVGLALDRVGFTVEDRDRTQGTYFVRYVDPRTDQKVERGFLGRLAFWRDDPKVNTNEQYRVRITDGRDGASDVQVLARDGSPDRSGTSKRILGLLHEQLR
jgi:outer membrane protein assembly factor BamC